MILCDKCKDNLLEKNNSVFDDLDKEIYELDLDEEKIHLCEACIHEIYKIITGKTHRRDNSGDCNDS